MRYFIHILLGILYACISQAQVSTNYKLTARYITTNNGLSSNSITALLQDPDGYIWIGTNNGLCRYDGYSIVKFRNISPDKKAKTDQHIGDLTKDAHNMFVKTSNTSVATYNFASARFTSYELPINHPKKTKKKATTYTFQGNGFTYENTKDDQLIIHDKNGINKKLDLLANAKYTTNKKHKYFVVKSGSHNYYIATYGNGLFRYDASNGNISHYSAQDIQPIIQSNFLTTILIDKDGCIWTGSEEAGISCIMPSQENDARYLFPEPASQGDWSNYVRAIHATSDQEAYIGTTLGKVYQCNLLTGKMTLVKKANDQIFDIIKDRDGHLWIGTRGDGIYIDNEHYTSKDPIHKIPADMVYDIVQDKMGRIWLASWEKGLLMTDGKKKPYQFVAFLNKHLGQSRIHDLEMDSHGILWIATCDGIYSIDTKRKNLSEKNFKHFGTSNHQLSGDEVICLQSTPQGKLYAGITGEGLVECHIDKQGNITKQEVISESLRINTNIVNSISQDRLGNLWIGTELGIYRLSSDYSDIERFEYSLTLTCNAYTENTSSVTPSGNLLFGTRNGLVIIKPQAVSSQQAARPCLITDLQVNGKSILESNDFDSESFNLKKNKIELEHTQNTLNIFFSRFNYTNSYNVYQYYLEGINEDWQEATTQSHVNYSDLAPGKYVFHVRGIINGKPQQETTFTIVINPPFYATWWAICLYLIIIGIIGYRVYRNRMERFHIHQQMKMEKQLTEFRLNFFTHVAHEFRTPLAIIQGGMDRLVNNKGTEPPQAAIASANRGAKRLLRLINQILEFRKINNHAVKLHVIKGNIIEFAQQLYKDFWNIANQKSIQLTFTPFAKQYEVSFDHEKVETILYNLLSNAVKYTPQKGVIEIKLSHEEDKLVFTVCNQGDEITAERKEHLFQPFMQGYTSQGGMGIGLYLAYQFAQLHKGNLAYSYDEEHQMNIFELSLPDNDEQYAPEDYMSEANIRQEKDKEKEQEETAKLNDIVREMQGEALNTQHVAIIEDDPDMMEQLKHDIGAYFRTDIYMNGQQGYAGVLTNPPSLIICDVMLPDLNGYDIVKRLRATEALKRVPVIMLTALDDEDHQIKGYKCGADDYMTKPYKARILMTRIIQLIKWNSNKNDFPIAPEKKQVIQTDEAKEKMKDIVMESKADKVFRENVVNLIAQNISEPDFTVDKIAEMMHMGRTKFFGKMKELTGMSPNKYLQAERMRIAAELLCDGRYNVSEVCMKVGIQDASYFYKCFKAKYGMPPSKYAQTQMVVKE